MNGFGNTGGEFWLGNQYLYQITTQGRYELRIDLEDFDGEQRYAYYDNFEIKGEENNFKLFFGSYQGNAGKCESNYKTFFNRHTYILALQT